MQDINPLYPIFLKANQLNILIVGGGKVGLEKMTFLLKNSPEAKLTVIAEAFLPEVIALAEVSTEVQLIKKSYSPDDLAGKDLLIVAVNDKQLSAKIKADATAQHLLTNVADTPDLCDFYLGAVVTKGNLKIGISTNGKSPTFAKRFRELLEETLSEDIDDLLQNLKTYRDSLKGDFEQKVRELNELTKNLIKNKDEQDKS